MAKDVASNYLVLASATFELDTRTLVEKSIDLEYIFTRASIVKKDAASILTS